MKRRLRKKKRLGEFQELGFQISITLRDGVTDDDYNSFFDRLMPVVEARRLGLAGGGGLDGPFTGFVTQFGRGTTTEADRAALASFLERDPAVVGHEFGPPRDVWYGWD